MELGHQHHFIIPPEGKLFHRSRSERCELCQEPLIERNCTRLRCWELISENDSSSSSTSHVRCGDYTTSTIRSDSTQFISAENCFRDLKIFPVAINVSECSLPLFRTLMTSTNRVSIIIKNSIFKPKLTDQNILLYCIWCLILV